MLRGEITLENGSRYEFVVTEMQARKLEQQVQEMNEYLKSMGKPEHWNIACELYLLANEALARMPDPAEETPGAATPGESR